MDGSNSDNNNSNGNGNGNNPWGWLGLLKWTLSHSDGTSPSSEMKMSEEDRKFLETVMKEGIIDENDRMKEILKRVTNQIELWRRRQGDAQQEDKNN